MWRRRRAEDEFSEEFSAHIELQTRKYIFQGMNAREAHRRALVEFGGVEKTHEECREVDRWRWVDASARNLTHCLRSLERSPAFASVSLLLLIIGIASNVAVFSTIDALFLRPLPIERPDEMVRIGTLDKDGRTGGLPSTTLDALQNTLQNDRLFSGICGVDTRYAAAELAGGMRTLGMAGVSGDCFRTLGVRMQLGRGIGPDDDRPTAERVAVITGSLWHEAFGGRPDALGRTIRIEDGLFTIVGVTEDRFAGLLLGFPEPVMIPLRQQPDLAPNGRRATYWWVSILGRRARGVSYAQALAGIAAQGSRLLEQGVPPNYNALRRKNFLAQKLTVTPAKNGFDYFLGRRFGDSLYAVFGLCGAILLMACVSLTSLLLARSLSRHREVAIRLTVGARRGHIAAIFILENAVLLVGGALAGSVLGLWAARVILDRGGRMFGNFRLETGFDWRVVLFLSGTLLVVLGVFTAASIWQAARLGAGLPRNNTHAQKILLGAQIALSLALVSAATLFGASLRNTYAIDFGIQPRNVWNVVLAPRPAGYRNFAPAPYYRDLLARIEALPGVVSASISHDVPFWAVSDKQPVAILDSVEVQAQIMPIGDRFFETLGAKIAAGEDFRRTGDDARELSVVISQSLAGKLGGRRDLIGHY
jgi:predicted permease